MRGTGAARLGEVLRDCLRRLPEGGELLALLELRRAWGRMFAGPLGRRTCPLSLRKGVLTVEVEGSAWLQQLRYLLPQLRERVNAELGQGMVREVRLAPGRLFRPERSPQAPCPSGAEGEVRELLRGLPAELREVLEGVLRRHYGMRGR